ELENRSPASGGIANHYFRRPPRVFDCKGKYQILPVEAAVEGARRGDRCFVRKLLSQAGEERFLGTTERRGDDARPAQGVRKSRTRAAEPYKGVWDKECLQSNLGQKFIATPPAQHRNLRHDRSSDGDRDPAAPTRSHQCRPAGALDREQATRQCDRP